ncbi:lytic transglycosylase domain-containing protein [Ramlibacter albus]|uniref:Lytic transglycosylase domain-containing protein n=1 Tax=Ramlibacter albus TaxID=2079448 RepID=A0A923M7M7_9BURK|nr:lytic transglycosylase domain-containing protein [Ramlibacter albus]MBC5764875.1 lytic transglycosylase domain-containing protein [Ramlibacter albus]
MQLRTIVASLVLLLAGGSQAQTVPRDDVILQMNQAFRAGDRARLTLLLPQARGHALEPYAAYWELRARLDTAGAAEVQDFFTRYPGTYQEDRLRNDWLLVLAQRRQWDAFADEYTRFRMRDDRQVRCYALLVQHLREGPRAPETLAEDVRRNWYAQREADDGCTLAAAELLADGHDRRRLNAGDIWRKARIAIEANRPRAAADAVQIVAPDAVNFVAELNANPGRFLSQRAAAISRTRRELVGLALIKYAATDFEAAAGQFDAKWSVQVSAEERDWIWGVLGKYAAQRLRPDAIDYFTKVSKDSFLSDDLLAWKVRAALRASPRPNWHAVLQAVNAMSDEGKADPTWAYWKARALLAGTPSENARAEAQRLLESIASPRGFYEQLALEALGQKINVPPKPAPLTETEKETARRNPGLNRALYAIAIGLRPEGVREWNYTTNLHATGGMSDRELLAAAQYACDREVWDRCVNTSDRTKAEFDFDQRYPMPFRESVVRRSREIGLDPAYVYGLIRQESRFIMDARSNVGASGLMQVMPATATWTAKKIGLSPFTPSMLVDRETNIAIGTGYLKLVLDDFAGSMPMAAAAYNAGPGRPRAWRNGPVMDAAAWAENIPFNETRDYVKKVLANTTVYAAMITGQPQSLRARLGNTIGPPSAGEPQPNREIP